MSFLLFHVLHYVELCEEFSVFACFLVQINLFWWLRVQNHWGGTKHATIQLCR